MQLLARLAVLPLIALTLAGCASDEGGDGHDGMGDDMGMMGPDSFHMQMSGVPSGMLAKGQKFNVTVQGMAGMAGMHGTSDHMGAHFWNRTVADPTGSLGNATACAHTAGDMPGSFTAMCTAPMAAGTYHLRGHMRMADSGGAMHHYWSDEQTFTVA